MMMYANKFTISADESGREVVLTFIQQSPIVNAVTGDVDGTNAEVVSNIVLTGSGARALSDLIDNVLDSQPDEDPE
jgi:hypothetical protein